MSTPFHDLDEYVGLARLSGLALSADGSRLVTTVASLDPKGVRYVNALWEVDPAGQAPPRRLTRSRQGESAAVFAGQDLLFTSSRPDPADSEDEASAAVWLAPAAGGEARVVCVRPGGVEQVRAGGDRVVLTCDVLPRARDEEDEARLRGVRKKTQVAAILHDGYPVRHWDADLGPGVRHVLVADLTSQRQDDDAGGDPARLVLRDVTPSARRGEVTDLDVAADGSCAVISWCAPVARGHSRSRLEMVDLESGAQRTVWSSPDADAENPRLCPASTQVVYSHWDDYGPQVAPRPVLSVVDIASGQRRALAPGWDRWPASYRWSADGSHVLVLADADGRCPLFAVEVASGQVRQLTCDDAALSDLVVAPDGKWAYALRSSYLEPAHPVRIDLERAFAHGPIRTEALRGPAATPALPGRLEEVETTAADGVRVRGWLALPHAGAAAAPAPLLVWIHGGPLSSWNTWSWRWNPWLAVAQGYAVLLPDPGLSTGYGQEFIQRGWNAWGQAPYEDIMAITDAVVARGDIDAERTAAMGGSFGGYMANWVAGHTDRFQAIVTHASLWALDQFGPTTDAATHMEREFSAAGLQANNPRLHVGQIRTPMLVIHGDKDYRVPIGEGLRLWYELLSASQLAADEHGRTPHRFLYFPNENHWVLSPRHAQVWYQVVLAFLAEHVLGAGPAAYPEVLG